MRRYLTLGSLFAVLTAGLILATVPGCPDTTKKPVTKGPGSEDKKPPDGADKKADGAAGGKAEALAAKAWDGDVKGTVTIEGKAPEMPDIDTKGHADTKACHTPKKQDWIVGSKGGVANVIVILEPPAGKFFAVDEKLAKEYKNPWIDQPLCVYEPHIVGMFAAYKGQDGKTHDTGLKLVVKNSGDIAHNTKIKGLSSKNPEFGKNLAPKSSEEYPVAYQKPPIDVSCDKHNWMGAKIITFDHPFFAVTDKDGNFEIKNVPTGVELGVRLWHEVGTPADGTADKAKTFSPGANELPLKLKAPA